MVLDLPDNTSGKSPFFPHQDVVFPHKWNVEEIVSSLTFLTITTMRTHILLKLVISGICSSEVESHVPRLALNSLYSCGWPRTDPHISTLRVPGLYRSMPHTIFRSINAKGNLSVFPLLIF